MGVLWHGSPSAVCFTCRRKQEIEWGESPLMITDITSGCFPHYCCCSGAVNGAPLPWQRVTKWRGSTGPHPPLSLYVPSKEDQDKVTGEQSMAPRCRVASGGNSPFALFPLPNPTRTEAVLQE